MLQGFPTGAMSRAAVAVTLPFLGRALATAEASRAAAGSRHPFFSQRGVWASQPGGTDPHHYEGGEKL